MEGAEKKEDKYWSEIEEDLTINELNLMSKSLELPKLQLKYVKKLLKAKERAKSAKNRLDMKKSDLLVKYKYKDTYKWESKELMMKIEGDPDYQEVLKDYNDKNDYVEFYQSIISNLNNMSFTIGNFVRLKTFYEGGK